MKKGQRPSRHYRIVATKRGRKRIPINPHIKNVRYKKKIIKKSFSANPLIKPKTDDLFEDYMAGQIEKGGVEEVDPKEFVKIRDKIPESKKIFDTLYA